MNNGTYNSSFTTTGGRHEGFPVAGGHGGHGGHGGFAGGPPGGERSTPPGGGGPSGTPGGPGGALPGMAAQMGGVHASIPHKLFDDKVPTYDEYRYDGVAGGDRWRSKVRGYWLSKCPSAKPMLDWAETRDLQAITQHDVILVADGWMTDVDALHVSALIWDFLNTALHGDAKDTFL